MSRAAPLLLVVAALLGCIALEIWPEHEEDNAMPAPSLRTLPVPAFPAAALPRSAVAAILARPLFSPDRRPAAAAAGGPASVPRLTGIIIEKDRRTALFAASNGARPLALGENGRVAGFTVQRIQPGEVTLTGPGGTRTLHPSFDPSAPAPGPAPSALPVLPPVGIPGLPAPPAPTLPSTLPVAR